MGDLSIQQQENNRSNIDVGWGGLVCSSSSQRCVVGLRSGLCPAHLIFFHTNLDHPWTLVCAQGHWNAGPGFASLNSSERKSKLSIFKTFILMYGCYDQVFRYLWPCNVWPLPQKKKIQNRIPQIHVCIYLSTLSVCSEFMFINVGNNNDFEDDQRWNPTI